MTRRFHLYNDCCLDSGYKDGFDWVLWMDWDECRLWYQLNGTVQEIEGTLRKNLLTAYHLERYI